MRPAAGGSVVDLWAVPGATRAGVAGLHGGALRVRVTAPAEGGAANREIVALLAVRLGLRARDVVLERGATGRRKCVRIHGLAPADVRARLVPGTSVDTSGRRN